MAQTAGRSAGIRFENIEKRYGSLYALRRVSLEVAARQCVVLAGRNGSGKTTLLRITAGLVRPSNGTIKLTGPSVDAGAGNTQVGFVAHATMVYDELTAEENLLLFAKLQNVPSPKEKVEALLQDVGLTDRKSSLVRTFSRGMRQRVAIARALLSEPSILLLDEPATGLDTQGVAWLAEKLRQLRDVGCTIVMSLHGESEVSSLSTRAIRLDGGSVVADTQTGESLRSILAVGVAQQ